MERFEARVLVGSVLEGLVDVMQLAFSFGSCCVMIGEFIHVDTMATSMLRNEEMA